MSTLLAMGTTNGLIYFWDLGRYERTGKGVKGVLEAPEVLEEDLARVKRGKQKDNMREVRWGEDPDDLEQFKKPKKRNIPIGRPREKEVELDDPQAVWDPHLAEDIPGLQTEGKSGRVVTTVRQCAWSPCGRYMIAVGDDRLIAVFERDLGDGAKWEDE